MLPAAIAVLMVAVLGLAVWMRRRRRRRRHVLRSEIPLIDPPLPPNWYLRQQESAKHAFLNDLDDDSPAGRDRE